MTIAPRGLRAALTLLSLLSLLPAAPAAAQPPNRSISLQASAAADRGGAGPGLSLAAGAWLEGDLDATARLAWRSAPRPGGRAAALALAGLRWAPDVGRWRPVLSLEGGAAWRAGRGAAGAGAVRAGLEWLPSRDWSLTAGAGLAWDGRAAAPEGLLAATCYF